MDNTIVQPFNSTDIAVINTNISYIVRDIGEIKITMKELSGVYATQVSVTDSNRAFDIRLKKLEERSALWGWLGPTMSAFIAAVLTFLTVQYFISFTKLH